MQNTSQKEILRALLYFAFYTLQRKYINASDTGKNKVLLPEDTLFFVISKFMLHMPTFLAVLKNSSIRIHICSYTT